MSRSPSSTHLNHHRYIMTYLGIYIYLLYIPYIKISLDIIVISTVNFKTAAQEASLFP
ncbi:hypothetical protein HanPSC8_Chr02g0049111 [Helianthus annuus]|nr:hypothetical protein HanPSC8_Chr02g0049111 [Helianthus annuus]